MRSKTINKIFEVLKFFSKKTIILFYQDAAKNSEAHLKNDRMLGHVHEIGLSLIDFLNKYFLLIIFLASKNFFILPQKNATNLGHCWKGFSQYARSFAKVQIPALCSVKLFKSYSFRGHWGLF